MDIAEVRHSSSSIPLLGTFQLTIYHNPWPQSLPGRTLIDIFEERTRRLVRSGLNSGVIVVTDPSALPVLSEDPFTLAVIRIGSDTAEIMDGVIEEVGKHRVHHVQANREYCIGCCHYSVSVYGLGVTAVFRRQPEWVDLVWLTSLGYELARQISTRLGRSMKHPHPRGQAAHFGFQRDECEPIGTPDKPFYKGIRLPVLASA